MKLIFFLLPVLFFQDCKSQPVTTYTYNKDENSLLWEISGNSIVKPSYLFGTFHLMCKEDIYVGQNVVQIVKNSDEVYFEMDMDDISNTLGALLFMNMKNEVTLQDLYSPEQLKKVESFFRDSLKTSMSFVQKIKPLLLQALLYPKMMSCKTMSGVEEVLMKLAKENKKEIKGLETFAFQASIFDSIPYTLQAKELIKAIDSIAKYKKSFDSLISVYKTQRLSDIEKLFTDSEFGLGENREILLDNRNKNWVVQLKKLLLEKALFVAVGAGHLVGENGLIELLRKAGFTLKPVENK